MHLYRTTKKHRYVVLQSYMWVSIYSSSSKCALQKLQNKAQFIIKAGKSVTWFAPTLFIVCFWWSWLPVPWTENRMSAQQCWNLSVGLWTLSLWVYVRVRAGSPALGEWQWGLQGCRNGWMWGHSATWSVGGSSCYIGHKKPATFLLGFKSRILPWEGRGTTNLWAPSAPWSTKIKHLG